MNGQQILAMMAQTSLADFVLTAMDAPNRRTTATWQNDKGEVLVIVAAFDGEKVKAGSEIAGLIDPLDKRDGVMMEAIDAPRIITDTRAVPTDAAFSVIKGGKPS